MVASRSAGFQRVARYYTVPRVGCVEARPWSYRAEQGVQELDTTAVPLVDWTMGCAIEYQPNRRFDQ